MSDDYLWDGSGEPDPEIEKLERLLGQYRYQPKQLDVPVRPRRFFDRRLAVAAAIILMVLAGLLALSLGNKSKGQPEQQMAGTQTDDKEEPPRPAPNHAPEILPRPDKPSAAPLVAQRKPGTRKAAAEPAVEPFDWGEEQASEESSSPDEITTFAVSLPADDDFFDSETARHIEKAQLLLRAFRNATSEGNPRAFDVQYEKEKSRELVYKNIVLRRDAEARNNYPVGELLASLEPLLLDIANLPASPSREEMRSIVERMQKTEIVATLQVHSGLLAIQNQ
jgi:hypothetical protein